MNRAFLIILAPALLVFVVSLGLGWGLLVSLRVGIALLLVAGVALLVRRRRGRPAARA